MNRYLKVRRIILSALVCLMVLTSLPVSASAATRTAQIPDFRITLNGVHIDNASRKYPFIRYNAITYFPMTYYDSLFLGLTAEWSAAGGLVINKTSSSCRYYSEDVLHKNEGSVPVEIKTGAVTVNGTVIDNSKEEYPLLTYKNVTYFPLTWRFTMDEFGWEKYEYTDEDGLNIVSAEKRVTETGIPATSFANGAEYYENTGDGYQIMLPAGIQKNEQLKEYGTSFTNGNYTLSVYKESFRSAYSVSSYINYTNSFTSDTVNFSVTDSGQRNINGLATTYHVWNRAPFTVVENDQNKYAAFDMRDGTTVYSLCFRYNDSISLMSDLYPIVTSFQTKTPTEALPTIQLGTTGSAKMNDQASAAYEKIFGANGTFAWGLFDMRAMTDLPSLRTFEKNMEYEFPILLVYTDFSMNPETMVINGKPLSEKLTALSENGQIPELTLQTIATSNGENMMFAVLRGDYDNYLHNYAKQVVKFGKPVLFRVGNEMNGDWCPYSGFLAGRDPNAFVEFYKHVFEIFREEGADNCIWVWNPNGKSFPDYKWNSEFMYYPGDAYVNVVGMTAYNTGNYYPGEYWQTFDQLYSNLYARSAARYAQPFMITEFASSSVGGDKSAWIQDMFAKMEQYPRIRAAVWWNGCDYADYVGGTIARPYYLQESQTIFDTFKNCLKAWNARHGGNVLNAVKDATSAQVTEAENTAGQEQAAEQALNNAKSAETAATENTVKNSDAAKNETTSEKTKQGDSLTLEADGETGNGAGAGAGTEIEAGNDAGEGTGTGK